MLPAVAEAMEMGAEEEAAEEIEVVEAADAMEAEAEAEEAVKELAEAAMPNQ
jgi:hypothetical protein